MQGKDVGNHISHQNYISSSWKTEFLILALNLRICFYVQPKAFDAK